MANNRRVGSRSGKYGSQNTKASDDFIAMLYNGIGKFTIHSEYDPTENEVGPDIIFTAIQMMRFGKLVMNLSSFTEAELLAFKEVLIEAIDWALPVVRRRDEEAQNEFNEGGESFERVYRAVPRVVYRTRISDEHSKGIFQRPENPVEVKPQPVNPNDRP